MKIFYRLLLSFLLLLIFCARLWASSSSFSAELYGDSDLTFGCRLFSPLWEVRTAFRELNNPCLPASAAPFSGSCASVAGVTANLPGYSSFSKPVSLFTQAGGKWKLGSVTASGWYSPEEDKIAASLQGNVVLFKKLTLASSFTSGIFPYNALGESSWFFDEAWYPQGLVQVSASAKGAKLCVMAGLNESPFGSGMGFCRAEGKCSFSHFDFFLAGFYCGGGEPNITSSGKVLEPLFQFKGNVQYKTVFRTRRYPVFMKTGFSLYSALGLEDEAHTVKAGAGSQLLFPLALVQFSLTANLDMQTELPEFLQPTLPSETSFSFTGGTAQLKNVWYFGDFSPSLSASVTTSSSKDFLSVSNTFKLNATLACSAFKNTKISCSSAFSAVEKDGELSSVRFASSLTASFVWKGLKCSGKLSFSLEG